MRFLVFILGLLFSTVCFAQSVNPISGLPPAVLPLTGSELLLLDQPKIGGGYKTVTTVVSSLPVLATQLASGAAAANLNLGANVGAALQGALNGTGGLQGSLGVFRVTDYGTNVGSGSDDSTAINAAVAAAVAAVGRPPRHHWRDPSRQMIAGPFGRSSRPSSRKYWIVPFCEKRMM